MSFIVEDGTGLVDANAFISVDEFYALADSRNVSTTNYTTGDIQGAIVVASQDYISNYYCFKGDLLNEEQGLALPTDEVAVNAKIKRATYEAALLQLNGNLFVSGDDINVNGAIKSEDKGLVTGMYKKTEYAEDTQYTSTKPTATVDNLLQEYLCFSGGQAPSSAWRY